MSFRDKARDVLMGLDLGYKYRMSDYAGSRKAEAEYEKQGLAEIDQALDALEVTLEEMDGQLFQDNDGKWWVWQKTRVYVPEPELSEAIRQQQRRKLKGDSDV